jgi:dynein heavy chain
MPDEAKIFENVNKQFLALTLKVQRSPAALRFIKSNPTVVENLTKMIEMLDRVQDRLNIYIDTKKQAFPRFYFLSIEDLIQILSNSEDKAIISLHLKSLFDGMVAVEFKDDNV